MPRRSTIRSWDHLLAILLVAVVGIHLLLAGIRGAMRGDGWDAAVRLVLAGAVYAGGMLIWGKLGRRGATILVGSLVIWIAWIVVTAPTQLKAAAPWWGALGLAGGLAWRRA